VRRFAPRRFAHAEKIKIREITDDLLARSIIKESNSPYCARSLLVPKKNGQLRLCVDLRPLNSRVIKQKFPFPLIEDCVASLGNKSVFTLLDLKDGFHQIKVHPNSTKYFAFATPDGQSEYQRLPFGFSESPAEFQRRLLFILRPLIRNRKVIVYIDDVMIASETVEENLEILREVLILFKQYGFELNFKKCKFLKRAIEYLGYVITPQGITISPRHTETIKNYPHPRNVLEVQRFFGLINFQRKFIQNFAMKVKPLRQLTCKDVKFDFNENCIDAFENIKKLLTSQPILCLYDPYAETELHTDASSHGFGGILVQK